MNGDFTYSNIVPVEFVKGDDVSFQIFPNPVSSGRALNLSLAGLESEKVLVVIRDIKGREFFSKLTVSKENDELIVVDLDSGIPSGMYLVVATSDNDLFSKKLLIK